MARDLAPTPTGDDHDGRDGAASAAVTDREVVDLTELHTRPAPPAPAADEDAEEPVDDFDEALADLLDGLPPSVGTERISTRMVVTGIAVMLAVVLAPLLVLLAVTAVPSSEQVQGGLLVAGWVALVAGARWIEHRRNRPHRDRHR